MLDFGKCDCGGDLQPIWYKEEETDNYDYPTGRVKQACSHLVCDTCLADVIVDSSFDGEWYYEKGR